MSSENQWDNPSRDDTEAGVELYSVVGVGDLGKALKWFGVFCGGPADEVVGEEYLWQVHENAWVAIDARDVRAERIGGAMMTLGFSDLDDFISSLDANGIWPAPGLALRGGKARLLPMRRQHRAGRHTNPRGTVGRRWMVVRVWSGCSSRSGAV